MAVVSTVVGIGSGLVERGPGADVYGKILGESASSPKYGERPNFGKESTDNWKLTLGFPTAWTEGKFR